MPGAVISALVHYAKEKGIDVMVITIVLNINR